jgi:PKD repeat protein
MAGHSKVGRRAQKSNHSHAARKGRRTAAGRAHRSGLEPLESRLLMSAVRPTAGFTLTDLGIGDDKSFPTTGTAGVSLGFSSAINFFGGFYNGVFVNNNGNISLGARNTFYSNVNLDSLPARVIAPFYANVDTRFAGSTVKYGRGTVDGHNAFMVNWLDVDYHTSSAGHTSRDSFQLVLVDRTDLGAGNFDMEFNYDQIRWESSFTTGGDANGLGGNSARIGWTANNGTLEAIYQMDGSNVAGSFLDGNLISGLVHNHFMSDVDGRYVYRFRDGTWADAPTSATNHDPVVAMPETQVVEEGPDGTVTLDLLGSFDDIDADNWTATVDYGDGFGSEPLALDGHGFHLGHTYLEHGFYTITVTVDDGHGGVGVGSMNVAVEDHSAPIVDVVLPALVRENEEVLLGISLANDPDASEAYSFEWSGSGIQEGASFHFLAQDNGVYTATLRVTDQSGNSTLVEVPVTVENVAPAAAGLSGSDTVALGDLVNVSLDGADDLSPADLAAGLVYSFDFDGDGLFDVVGSSASASWLYADSGSYVVHARVSDKDGGSSDYTKMVHVANTPPVSSLSNSGDVAEGGTVTFSFGPAIDSQADLDAGLTYSFDLDGDGAYEVSGASGDLSHTFDDNGTYTVHGRVSDRHGAYSEYETTVHVSNVAPTATLVAPADGDEGQALSFSLAAVSDPSGADSASLTYSFDFDGDGVYEVVGGSPAVTHVFDDNGNYTVHARVSDKDGGSSEYSAVLHVKNVPPRNGHFVDNNPIAEGSLVTVSFGGQDDPSAADTAAGFTYSYDFDGDGVFEVVGRSASATHAFNDNGVYVVRGRVTDKDGGYTDYTTDVEVYNVAPTAVGLSAGLAVEGSAVSLRLDGVSDPSSVDRAAGLTYSFDLNNDGVFDVTGSRNAVSTVFKNDGVYTVRARVSDKDGGYTDYTTSVMVSNAAPVITGVTNSAGFVGAASAGSAVTVGASFADAGVLDTHGAVIDWGDGSTSTVAAVEANGSGSAKGSHAYAQGGVYTVTLKVRDDAGAFATSTTQVFVTGVGLRNGVLEIVGTAGDNRVDVSADNRGNLTVKTDFARNLTFNGATVREIHATLGAGRDTFSADADVRQPIYVNGLRYVPPTKGGGKVASRRITRSIFSDRLVA